MTFRDDFGGVEQKTFDAVPTGNYNVEVFSVEVKESVSGNEYYNWKFRILDEAYRGRYLFLATSKQKQALWKLQSLLGAIGLDVSKKLDWDESDVTGKRLKVKVIIEQWEGEDRSRVDKVFPADDATNKLVAFEDGAEFFSPTDKAELLK